MASRLKKEELNSYLTRITILEEKLILAEAHYAEVVKTNNFLKDTIQAEAERSAYLTKNLIETDKQRNRLQRELNSTRYALMLATEVITNAVNPMKGS